MAHSAAALFAAGAASVLASLLLDGGETLPRARIVGVAGAALVVALGLQVIGPRLRDWVFHAVVILGASMVSIVVHQAGGGLASAGYASLYVVASVYAFFFFERPAAVLHLVVTAGMSLVVLAEVGGSGWWVLWLMVMSTASMVGVLVSVLVEQVRSMARADMLTGLANRRAWEESLPREVSRAARAARPLSVAVIDLDFFKEVNDAGGHHAGDQTLRTVAAAWSSQVRESDLLARYGGDEFALVMPDCDADQARVIVDRLRETTPTGTTFSAGIATWDGQETITELVRRADEAMYAAKIAGRARTIVSSLN